MSKNKFVPGDNVELTPAGKRWVSRRFGIKSLSDGQVDGRTFPIESGLYVHVIFEEDTPTGAVFRLLAVLPRKLKLVEKGKK